MLEDPHPINPPHGLVRPLAAVAIVGPLFYIGLTTGLGLFVDGYDPIRDTQSELGAVDSPVHHLMNFTGFAPLGLSILGFAALYALVVRRGWVQLLAVLLLGIAGVGMVAVSFFPCDAGCVDITDTGRMHGLLSAPGAIGLPVTAMISAYLFRDDPRFGTRWQSVSFWLGALALASGPVVAAGLLEDAVGLLQRAGMWSPLIWMSITAARLAPAPTGTGSE